MKTQKAEGNSVDGNDDHWTVNCPNCEREYEYTGYFDSGDITNCACGCKFTTSKVWINDKTYME